MAVFEKKNPACYGNTVKSEDTIKMEKLEKQGWFGRQELEQFIFLAREQQKLESLVWLMRLKDRKYGYEERKLII